jgi:hypothetical protein
MMVILAMSQNCPKENIRWMNAFVAKVLQIFTLENMFFNLYIGLN